MNQTTWQQPTTPQPPVRRKKFSPAQKWVAVGIAVAFLAIIGAASNHDDSAGTNDRSATAFEMCKKSVRTDLRAPGTAKFRDYFGDQAPSVSGSGDGPYTVISTVDSQNGFGAMLRSSFVCTATYIGSDQWSVDSTVS